MPSHAAPKGARSRAARHEARRRRVRRQLRAGPPLTLMFLTVQFIMGSGVPGGAGLLGWLAGVAETILLMLVIGFLLLIGLTLADAYAQRLAARQVRPRPRWQYLVLALGYAGVAAAAIYAAGTVDHGKGPLANTAGVSFMWCAAAALTLLGRAACWGRARRVLFWHRPRWLSAPSGGSL